ncbi:cytochrome P450 [Actinokineospora soli]|uniref:Cytochrome P450 n=1 Tax=Actinokineospora soli TaxID=1048753 RepID=A0ABW2TS13_9PSEU
MSVPEIDATDPELYADPFAAYGRAREAGPLARLVVPGMAPMWVVTRYDDARAVLADPRFRLSAASYLRPAVDPDLVPYLRTMGEVDGPEHARLRRLVAPAFTARRAAALRPRVQRVVDGLLAGRSGPIDLVAEFARPLPMEVICDLVGIVDADRPAWREHGAAIAGGAGQRFAAALPDIVAGAKAAIARRRAEPGPDDDLIAALLRARDEDGDRLTDVELVSVVWHLVLAGQTPTNLVANAVEALLDHPDQLALLRAEPGRMPAAVEELTRWCTPQLLTVPRFPTEDVDFHGRAIPAGEPVVVAIAAVNRDPRVFADGLDVTRPPAQHLAYAHGPHYCLGAALARVEVDVALTALTSGDLALAGDITRAADPGTWRMAALPVNWKPRA